MSPARISPRRQLPTASPATISSAANGSGATLTLSGASTATTTANTSGAYSFTGLANGSYTVTASKSGFTFSPSSLPVTVNGANVTGENFTASAVSPTTYSISGTISAAANGSGATVRLAGAASATTTANSSGAYTFTGLANGSYTVAASKSWVHLQPSSLPVTVSGANVTGENFTASAVSPTTYSISGTISSAANGSGATLTLAEQPAPLPRQIASGAYSFTGLANGSYTITASKSGFTFSPSSLPVTVNGANVTGENFTASAVPPTTYSISGTISPRGEWIWGYPDTQRSSQRHYHCKQLPVLTVLPASPMVPTQSRPARAGSLSAHPACR